MKKSLVLSLLLVSGALVAHAQQPIRVGLFAGYGTKVEKPAVGLIGEIGIIEKLAAAPSFAYYFMESSDFAKVSFWEFNANAHYYLVDEGPISVYGLAGVNVARSSVSFDLSDTGMDFGSFGGGSSKVGLNIGGGANFDFGAKILPFAELKYTIAGTEQVGIFLGVKYSIR